MQETGINFIIFLAFGILLLGYDLRQFVTKRKTLSETIWRVNQFTLALAFIFGLIVGHLFTVPASLP